MTGDLKTLVDSLGLLGGVLMFGAACGVLFYAIGLARRGGR
jgi:hypothetical protein